MSLQITLISGRNLIACDKGVSSDPYAVITIPESKEKFKSKRIKKTLNPTWNETFTFNVKNPETDVLQINIWDHDLMSKHDPMGDFVVKGLDRLPRNQPITKWYKLQNVEKGEIQLCLQALDFGIDIPQAPPEPNRGEIFSNFAMELWESKKFSDLVLITLERPPTRIHVHKFVLYSFSSYFAKVCSIPNEITIPGISGDLLNSILQFIYTGEIFIPEDVPKLLNLIKFSKLFELEHLRTMCERQLMLQLTKENVLGVLRKISEIGIEGPVKQRCIQIVESSYHVTELVKIIVDLTSEMALK